MADFEVVLGVVGRVQEACRLPAAEIDPAASAGVRISRHQARILSHLDVLDPVMVGELAEHLGVTASTMSLTLKRLEAAGWVRRARDPQDRRVTNVRLTEEGARVRERVRALDPERAERILALLPPGGRAPVLEALALLGEAADRLLEREREDVEAQL